MILYMLPGSYKSCPRARYDYGCAEAETNMTELPIKTSDKYPIISNAVNELGK